MQAKDPSRARVIEPLVDVVIPTLGESSSFLGESIESVLMQAFWLWSLLVSPTRPGTRAQEIVEPFLGDSRVRVTTPSAHLTAAENFTQAVQRGTATYVALLHDDDRWRPEFLSRSVEFLNEHPSCGFVFSGAIKIDESGRPLGRERLRLREGAHASSSVLPRLYRTNFITAPSVVVRRSAYEAVGGSFRDLLFLDHDMWLRLAARFDVGCVAMWETEYRIHPSQTSSQRRMEFGLARLALLDESDALPVSRSTRRLARAEAHASCSLDQAELGDRGRAMRHVVQAVRSDPRSLFRFGVTARLCAALGAVVLGDRGRRALTRQRVGRWEAGGVES